MAKTNDSRKSILDALNKVHDSMPDTSMDDGVLKRREIMAWLFYSQDSPGGRGTGRAYGETKQDAIKFASMKYPGKEAKRLDKLGRVFVDTLKGQDEEILKKLNPKLFVANDSRKSILDALRRVETLSKDDVFEDGNKVVKVISNTKNSDGTCSINVKDRDSGSTYTIKMPGQKMLSTLSWLVYLDKPQKAQLEKEIQTFKKRIVELKKDYEKYSKKDTPKNRKEQDDIKRFIASYEKQIKEKEDKIKVLAKDSDIPNKEKLNAIIAEADDGLISDLLEAATNWTNKRAGDSKSVKDAKDNVLPANVRKKANQITAKYSKWIEPKELQKMYNELNAIGISVGMITAGNRSTEVYYNGNQVDNSKFVYSVYKDKNPDNNKNEYNIYFS